MDDQWAPDAEYRRLFHEWAQDPTQERWDAMNRAADELDVSTDRLLAAIRDAAL
jgi:acyl-CoA reductase-like NAD-dependent aldehyde dehydrogenase